MKRFLLFLVGGSLFFLFVFFSHLVATEVLVPFDFDTTVRLQDTIPRRFDQLFSLLSDIGSFEPVTIFLFILLVLGIRRWKILFPVFFYGLFHVIEVFGKGVVDQLPPPEFLLRTKKIIEFPQFHVREEFSYPSGHAGRAAFLTVLLGFLLLKTKKLNSTQKMFIFICVLMYDSIMFISRAYLGEHWVTDVVGGALLGTALGLLSLVLL